MRVIKKKDTGELYIVVANDVGRYFIVPANDEWKCECISNYDLHKEYEQFPTVTNDSCEVERIVHKTEITTWGDIVHSDISEFTVGDVYNVPLSDGTIVSFEIKHIENKKVYFVSKDILAEMPMTEVYTWLSAFEKKLPIELRDCLCEIEHITRRMGKRMARIMLPSAKNVGGVYADPNQYIGADDIVFDGFRVEANKCKNFNGKTRSWITDSLHIANVEYSYFVGTSGDTCIKRNDFGVHGICPMFALQVMR